MRTRERNLTLVPPGDPLLTEDLTSVVSDPLEIRNLYLMDMLRLCSEKHGVGLAANQVGLRMNFFVVTEGVKLQRNKAVAHACIHPVWRPAPKAVETEFMEGCLSYPGRKFRVRRWSSVVASWQNALGHQVTDFPLKGLAAQVFQHESDHLRGVTLMSSGEELT